ncbi:hypothetical protein [Enterococcus faecium]|uniref:hypothetical protein n=1 Tax=Enterococcus faecium TaxID=1352 RepID=UPI003D312518
MSNKKKMIGILLVLFCLLGAALYWYFHPKSTKEQFKEDIHAVGYNPNIEKPENFTKDQVALPGFPDLYVEEGATETNMALMNPAFNEAYLKYTVIFDQTNKNLIETEGIAPGKAVKGFKIPEGLNPGEYPLTINIKTYDKQTKATLNGGASHIKLIVYEKKTEETSTK